MTKKHDWAVKHATARGFVAGRILPSMLIALWVIPGINDGPAVPAAGHGILHILPGDTRGVFGSGTIRFRKLGRSGEGPSESSHRHRGDAENFFASTYIKEVPTGRCTTRTPQSVPPAVEPRGPDACPAESDDPSMRGTERVEPIIATS